MNPITRLTSGNLRRRLLTFNGAVLVLTALVLAVVFLVQVRVSIDREFERHAEEAATLTEGHLVEAVVEAFLLSLLPGALILAVALLVLAHYGSREVRPLEGMAEVARRVAAGDLAARVDLGDGDDEMSRLARAFNEMTWSLADSQEELARRNRELETVAEEKERLYRNAQVRATRLEVMNELAKAISASLDPDEIYAAVHKQLSRLLQFEYFTIQRYLPEERSLRRDFVWIDRSDGSVAPGQEIPLEESPIQRVLQTRMPLSIPDFDKDSALNDGWLRRNGFLSGFIVPIVARDEFLGSLGLACRRRNAFARMEVATVFAIADTLAVVLKNADLYRRLQASYDELRDTQERLTRSENVRRAEKLRSVGQMTSGIAHNFNNVLSTIIGRVQLLRLKAERKHLSPEELLSGLDIVEQAALDGSETVRRLQDFSRSTPTQRAVRTDLNDLVRGVVEITRPRWKDQVEQRGHRVDLVTDLGQVPLITCIPGEIREVLTNLIFNAVDAMPEGGEIRIRTLEDDGFVRLVVTDTGEGMPEAVRERVFDPFFTTKGHGTGLGLSTVHGIIERHRGKMAVDSEPGVGTTFTIHLPVAGENTPGVVSAETVNARPWRILVGDDEDNVREALADLLRMLGHAVVTAADGRSTVAAYRQGTFDAVFTDLGMPDLSGWEVTQAIREHDQTLPIVLATGWGAQLDEDEAMARGITRILAKPFTVQKVSSLIAELQGARPGRKAA